MTPMAVKLISDVVEMYCGRREVVEVDARKSGNGLATRTCGAGGLLTTPGSSFLQSLDCDSDFEGAVGGGGERLRSLKGAWRAADQISLVAEAIFC